VQGSGHFNGLPADSVRQLQEQEGWNSYPHSLEFRPAFVVFAAGSEM
jgi:hypothetical protein